MSTLLEQEIASQPESIARLLERELGRAQEIVARLPAFSYALIAARGTSDHAATYAQYVWGAIARHPVALATPSLHTLYQSPPRMDGALVVGVSQSGQSPDIVSVVEEGRRQGRPTLAITNDPRSPLAAAAGHVIELHAGEERGRHENLHRAAGGDGDAGSCVERRRRAPE
jgi:glucosamine--fructose-6-phosphate aminotransferase (isomerizing)